METREVTSEEVENILRASGEVSFPHHACEGCGSIMGHRLIDDTLYFDAGCKCMSPRSQLRRAAWGDIADYINTQDGSGSKYTVAHSYGIDLGTPYVPPLYFGQYTSQWRVEWRDQHLSGICITHICTVAGAIRMWKSTHEDTYIDDSVSLKEFMLHHRARYLPPIEEQK